MSTSAPASRPSRSPWRLLDWFSAERPPASAGWTSSPRVSLALVVACTLVCVGVGFLGPSTVTVGLGPRDGWQPSWYLPVRETPNEWVVTPAVWLVALLGGIALWVGLRALRAGWRPRVRRLVGLGVGLNLVSILVPPMTSADVLMYAAYGRLKLLGYDPYTITPAAIFRQQYDPVLRWTERPWQDTPSVYGPILNWMQWLANVLGGPNMHDVVFWLQLFCCLAFIGCCLVAVWIARSNPALQGRVVLLTLCNPCLIWAVVVGAHNEAVAAGLALAGFAFLRRHAWLAGLLVGLGCSAKATLGLYGIAMVWAYRHQWRRLVVAVIAAGIPSSLAYFVIEPGALQKAFQNGGYIASTSWVPPFHRLLLTFLDSFGARFVIAVLAWGGMIAIAWMLSRTLPWRAAPGLAEGEDPRRDPLTIALRTSLILSAAWVTTSAWSLAWYDLIVWLPLALLGPTRLDLIMIWRITALNLAFIPGRVIGYSELMKEVSTRIKDVLSNLISIGILAAIVIWWHERGLRVGSHTRPAEVEQPADVVDHGATVSR